MSVHNDQFKEIYRNFAVRGRVQMLMSMHRFGSGTLSRWDQWQIRRGDGGGGQPPNGLSMFFSKSPFPRIKCAQFITCIFDKVRWGWQIAFHPLPFSKISDHPLAEISEWVRFNVPTDITGHFGEDFYSLHSQTNSVKARKKWSVEIYRINLMNIGSKKGKRK